MVNEDGQSLIEYTAATSFVNGLPPDLLIRVKLEQRYSLEANVVAAVQLSKTMEIKNARKRSAIINRPSRADPTYILQHPPQNTSNNNSYFNTPPRNQTQQPYVKPLIPGQPGPNFPATKICNYCKTPGHFMKDCRKLAYRKTLEQNPLQPLTSYKQNSGNFQGVPMPGALRNGNQQERQVFIQQPPKPANINTITIKRENPLQESIARQENLVSKKLIP